jgi:hypothetical protein
MDQKKVNLFDDEDIKKQVIEVWATVFSASNIVIQHAKQFGFDGMVVVPNPNIHQLLVPVRLLSQWIEVFLCENMEYDQVRLMLNAKQQLLRMEMVAAALEAGDLENFNRTMEEIQNQAQI